MRDEQNQYLISVIVPIYNIEKYLNQCLESICNQSYNNLEIILVDDGSIDNSDKICDEFALKDTRIKVIHKINEGVVRARKTGLAAAKGRYIGYVDGDDWIEPNMFERLYEVVSRENVDVAMCGRYEDTGNSSRAVYHGFPEGRYDKHKMLKKVYPNMIVNGEFFEWGLFPGVWDKLFRKEILEKYQMEVDERLTMGEDAACVYPCLLNANSIYILNECLYHYRQSISSMVKQDLDNESIRERFNILYNSVMRNFVKDKYIFDLRDQWRDYLLFLMVPRIELLYKDVKRLEFLFPFPKVKRGSNIILYGMGTYGQLLYRFICHSGICNVVACADRNYLELNKQGLKVIAPDEIENFKYDFIVIANSFASVRKAIYKELSNRYPANKIQLMDEKMIRSDETLRAFGLM